MSSETSMASPDSNSVCLFQRSPTKGSSNAHDCTCSWYDPVRNPTMVKAPDASVPVPLPG